MVGNWPVADCYFELYVSLKTKASVLFLGFQYYVIFINEVQYSVLSSFIDSGASIVSPIFFVLALVLNSKNNFIIQS